MWVKQHRHPAAQLQACRAHVAAAQAVASAEAARPPVIAVVCWHMPDMVRGASPFVMITLSNWSLLHGCDTPGRCSTEEGWVYFVVLLLNFCQMLSSTCHSRPVKHPTDCRYHAGYLRHTSARVLPDLGNGAYLTLGRQHAPAKGAAADVKDA